MLASSRFAQAQVVGPSFAYGSVPTGGAAQALSSSHPPYVVPDWYKQAADENDDAPSIQRAIASGLPVILECRHYAINSPTTITRFFSMHGCGWNELNTAGGTWFDIGPSFISGVGSMGGSVGSNARSSPFTMTGTAVRGSVMEGIGFDMSSQLPPAPGQTSWVPNSTQPALLIYKTAGMVTLRDLMFDGIYDAIKSVGAGRTTIDNIYGQTFFRLFFQDDSEDISRVTDVHQWPYWNHSAAVLQWQQSNMDTLVFERSDTPYITRIFSFAGRSAIHIAQSDTGTFTGAQITDMQCDFTVKCIWVDSSVTSLANFQLGSMRTFAQEDEPAPTFTGSIAGTTLTITAISNDYLKSGMTVTGSKVTSGTAITGVGSGRGGAGTYTLNKHQAVPSEAMTGSMPVTMAVDGSALWNDGALFAQIGSIYDFGTYDCTICSTDTTRGSNMSIGAIFAQNAQLDRAHATLFNLAGPDAVQLATQPQIAGAGNGFQIINSNSLATLTEPITKRITR